MQVFSDNGESDQALSGERPSGWETLGSLAERKKENTTSAQPWIGEKLNPGTKQNAGVPKMAIFKDQVSFVLSLVPNPDIYDHRTNDGGLGVRIFSHPRNFRIQIPYPSPCLAMPR